ncbi:4-hydroxybenzoate polyprenyltransferase [Octadecabacter temperatus]|uniref:Decaprenyl-phosphate phosphoribosyltransferase n=1 Tax=Octadecabacter temperatus TaxID=1458307 RepID=A0A0K0Y2X9_9RHOB|nr:UbiA family prenyltransferase [Octadecabacter temperatus]AKS45300.1 Decaprenyl-phosphate phosphoribosyltransferase [Octadecabacter temperatus]SIN90083.1 4-hydroxybenzoate polyprenyltransferase [Octadecabacter temperatus]
MSTKPLVLDADGTLLRTDMLLEGIWKGLGTDPAATLKAFALIKDRAAFKTEIARIAPLRIDLLPVNGDIAAMAVEAKDAGREVSIASASDISLVQPLAEHYGIERVFASENGVNLKGSAKADALVAAYGEKGFDYAGNDKSDRKIWDHSDGAIVVGNAGGGAKGLTNVVKVNGGWSPRAVLKSMRPHQWVKNVLLFLPMIAAHAFFLDTFLAVCLGIISFSAAASCIYIVNDLLDIEADRLHVKKCKRPFAAGTVPIPIGMLTCAALGVIALGVAAMLSVQMFGVVAFYMSLSLAYSLRLKRMRWIDIMVLASLYTLRVVAGAAASGVDASVFMLIFIFPVFISLGCVKRMTELALAKDENPLPGRGYARRDMGDLLNMSAVGMIGALVIFFLYSFSEQALALYPDQWLMWVALLPIAAWLYRMIKLGYMGQMDYDPIVFAMSDIRGIGFLLITLSLLFYAAGLWSEWYGRMFG